MLDWLRELQAAQSESRRHDFVSLAQLQAWSEVPGGTGLFDSIGRLRELPLRRGRVGPGTAWPWSRERDLEPTNYPLSVVVAPGDTLAVHLDYDPAAFDASTGPGPRREPAHPADGHGPPARTAAWPTCRCWTRPTGAPWCTGSADPWPRAPRDTLPEASGGRPRATPVTPRGPHTATPASPTANSTPAPAGWPGCSSAAGAGPERFVASACPAPPT
ncbi:hypothetical protein GCM10017687_01040 [Streptomyces echinatus]|uniref:hypothetical protein n=1 Tax=Streptomyces echinatus TaxID=67293 RepID=UPI0031EF1E83